MTTDKTGIVTYKYFSTLEGNQNIASEFALIIITKFVKSYRSKNILELGLGIGSISYAILHHSKSTNQKINYVGTEANEFCLEVLPKYLKEYYNEVTIFKTLDNVLNPEKFDFIIIDGMDDSLSKVKDIISNHGIIIIEGDRKPQLNLIRCMFPNSFYTRVLSNYNNPSYGPFSDTTFCGGIQLIFINPSLKQLLDYLFYKIQTAVRYRIRAFNK